MSAQPIDGAELARGDVARLAAHELGGALVRLELALTIARDAASPGYKLDELERRELRRELEHFDAWAAQHAGLLGWARAVHSKRRRNGGAGRW